jgi:hypothetical protein
MILSLNDDCLILIIEKLDTISIKNLKQVCKKFYEIYKIKYVRELFFRKKVDMLCKTRPKNQVRKWLKYKNNSYMLNYFNSIE